MFNSCKNCNVLTEIKKNMIRLSDLNLGDSAIVVSIAGNDELRIRIMEMGIVNETEIKIIKKAPFGDPIDILVRGYELTLRKNEEELIFINKK